MKRKYVASFLLFALIFLGVNQLLAAEKKVEYVFGVVPQYEQRKLFRIWHPILVELEKRTGLFFKIKGSAKIPDFEKEFLAGNYDFAYMNPYHIVKAHNQQGYIPFLRDTSRQLRGVLVVKKDSNIDKVEQLDGALIAFPAPNALGASLLMRTDLSELYQIKFEPRYVKTHSSVYLHVALGQTRAGGGVLSTLNSQKAEIRNMLKVLYQTRPMSPHPICAHPRVPEKDREAVKQALLEMAKIEKWQQLFSKIPMKKPAPANMLDYEEIQHWGLDKYWVN